MPSCVVREGVRGFANVVLSKIQITGFECKLGLWGECGAGLVTVRGVPQYVSM